MSSTKQTLCKKILYFKELVFNYKSFYFYHKYYTMNSFKYYCHFIFVFIAFQSTAQNFYTWVDENRIPQDGTRWIIPQKFKTIQVNMADLKTQLKTAPTEFTGRQPLQIEIPLPDGSNTAFNIVQTNMMEKALADKYPEIKTYTGYAVHNPSIILKMDVTYQGLHGYIVSPNSIYAIDPYHNKTTDFYVVYDKKDYQRNADAFECLNDDNNKNFKLNENHTLQKAQPACALREYRVAVNATGEYTQFHGGTVSAGLSAVVTIINRMNLIFERDVALRLTLVANNDQLIYTDAANDPFTQPNNPDYMIERSHFNLNSVIGNANYDVGHVFSTTGAGLASLGSACNNNLKGYGLTGVSPPIGDLFAVDYAAHEFGHQFNAQHTFDYCVINGTPEGNGASGMEPGGGSTIMAYAGVCGNQNIQNSANDYFHSFSVSQITSYTQINFANSCANLIPINNTAPEVEAGNNYSIPANTPFQLTGSATDVDGDMLTYCWEEFESGTDAPIQNPTPNSVLFRSWSPTSENFRIFPRLFDLLNNNTAAGETLPFSDRTMRFRLTVRDNHLGGSCTNFDNMNITVDGDAGPFVVNSPNGFEVWKALDVETVSWNVANTDQAPVSCSNVDILLSTDGGNTYPTTIVANVPNTGSYNITVPNNITTVARVKVVCSGNIFFDISNSNFEITNPGMPSFTLNAESEVKVCVGEVVSFPIEIGQIQNFSTPVNLSTSYLPGSLQVNFDTNPATPGSTVMVTLSNTDNLAANNYYGLTIDATAGSQTDNVYLDLVTVGATVAAPALSNPSNGYLNFQYGTALTWQGDFSQILDYYQIEIATDPLFNNIIESETTVTQNFEPALAIEESTTYYWRVSGINACGESTWSNIYQYTTEKCISLSNTANVNISEVGTPTITSTINVSNAGLINSVSLFNIAGTHTWISDLEARLTSPEGTTLQLFTGLCNSEDNFNIDFSSSGSLYSSIPCPPTDGNSYIPIGGTFNNFIGEDANGTWTLTIIDNYSQDGGQLSSWGINICTDVAGDLEVIATASTESICDGNSATLNANGAQNYIWSPPDGLNTITGTQVEATPQNTTTYTVTGTDNTGNINTGQVTINVGSGGSGANVSISGLPPSITDGLPVTLTGSPAGGTFSGEGISFSIFNPSLVLPGTHTITYTYDDGSGCVSSVSENVLVGQWSFNFVTYELGTIEPKIIIEIDVHKERTYPITLFNVQGKILYQNVLTMYKGKQQFEIIPEQLIQGIYFLKIGNNPVEKLYVH